jgi:hypothetical protein
LAVMDEAELRKKILSIQLDKTLSEAEKAKKRQELLTGKWTQPSEREDSGVESQAQPTGGTLGT